MLSMAIAPTLSAAPSLIRYNVKSVRDLPADANGTGFLADGSVYIEPYKMLTASDRTFLKTVTGESFDAVAIALKDQAGTFKGNALAAAMGFDRATGVLSGEVSTSYLNMIDSALNNTNGTNGYEGFQVTTGDLTQAFATLQNANNSNQVSST